MDKEATWIGGNYTSMRTRQSGNQDDPKEDQGIYTCVATNILGKAENQVLEVKGKERRFAR